ncbi:MAG: hypothetical protein ABI036_16015 [Fibrobacteria bacterium]
MFGFRRNRFKGAFVTALMAVFFASQAFSCCHVNQLLGRFVLSSLSPKAGIPENHACCPASRSAQERHASDAGTNDSSHTGSKSGCCIQDANQKLPQMASEQVPVPDMTGLVLALLPLASVYAPYLPPPPDLQSRSGPPVYLTTLRLLI